VAEVEKVENEKWSLRRGAENLFLFTLERLRKEDFEGSLYGFGISAFGA
jgi:hypothetical protein